MKLSIKRHVGIFGMAKHRYEAIDALKEVKDIINEHIIKCVVYHDERPCTLKHWIGEVAACLKQVDAITCRSALKQRDYMRYLFGPFGDAKDDAEWNLSCYKFKNERRPDHEQYPDFEITDELVGELYETYQAIISASLPWLIAKTKHSMTEWTALISPILI